ncbi:helicase-like protein [Rathayibacter sp. PhB151]|uniref:SNF2-related protein n=1 Tax=Rathayibacter sp. PhB151 TaxID=2485189 RepID=UPI00106244B2|nr:DEAD/DEAH box helicase [Rathayibacter sp. PhB151]TDX78697.1 helicase-like protein [Rathayibacter sp. PhB151]
MTGEAGRTYGRYHFQAPPFGSRSRGTWQLELEPQVRTRARRIFGRLATTRTTVLEVAATPEVARDIEWLMDRWPLVPASARDQRFLEHAAEEHRVVEQQVGAILDGRLDFAAGRTPSKEAREYQQAAIALLRTRGRMLLTDEVGLGKTFTALLALSYEDALPALVVPPTHLPPRWIAELQDAFPWLDFELARSKQPSIRARQRNLRDVTIVPYSKLDGWGAYMQGQVRTVIFDEVQELRNGVNTEKGKAAALAAQDARYVLGLSATPIYNYGGEIWNILDILAPGELGTREEFGREWGGLTHSTGQQSVTNPAALGGYLRENGLMLGRTRKDVGRELPDTVKVSQLIDHDTAELAAATRELAEIARRILADDSSNQEKFLAGGEIDMKLRHATGIAKAHYVAHFCKMLLESEDKIVLFGWHRDVWDIWQEQLADFQPAMYTGTENATQKAEAIDAFVNGDSRVLMMSLRSGAGVDGLQKVARVAVFGELDWSPEVHEQAIGRLRRDGMSEDPPVAYFLNIAEGSDPVVLERLHLKRQQAEPLLSRDGELRQNSTPDPHRARRLAEQILGITRKDTP